MTLITNMPLYRAIVIKAAIGLYLKTNKRIIANSGYTPANMLKAATSITGKAYKRGQHQQALIDIGHWITVQSLEGKCLTDEVSL